MKLWIARILVVLFVIVVVLAVLYWQEVSTYIDALRPGDSGAEITDDGVVQDSEFDFAVRIGSDWQVFERLYTPENRDLPIEEIAERLGTCGADCAAAGVIKMGDFPGTNCETDACAELQTESYGGAALTVYVFGNSSSLELEEFVATALGKSVWAEHFESLFLPDGAKALRETITASDGSSYVNMYVAGDGLVYWLNQDIIADDLSDYGDISRALQEVVASFEIQ